MSVQTHGAGRRLDRGDRLCQHAVLMAREIRRTAYNQNDVRLEPA